MPSPTALVVKNGSKMWTATVCRNARSVVGDLDQGDLGRGRTGIAERLGLGPAEPRASQGDAAAAGAAHRVAGVDHQVHHRVLELRLVGAHRRRRARVVGDEPHVLAQQAAQQHLEAHQGLADVDDLAPRRRLAREGEELAHQVGGAQHGVADLAQTVVGRIAERMAQQQLVGAQADGGEQVVEVVRHAAGELADGFHLVALGKLAFERLLVGDVDQPGGRSGLSHRQIELSGALRRAGGADIKRPAPSCRVAPGRLAARGGGEQAGERAPAFRRGAHDLREPGIELQDGRSERIARGDDRRSERRGADQGAERRRPRRRLRGRCLCCVAPGLEAQQEPVFVEGGDTDRQVAVGMGQGAVGESLPSGLEQGREQPGGETQLTWCRAHRPPPGGVGGDDASVGVTHRRSLLEPLQQMRDLLARLPRSEGQGGAHRIVLARDRAASPGVSLFWSRSTLSLAARMASTSILPINGVSAARRRASLARLGEISTTAS